jgi:hypothetical protein
MCSGPVRVRDQVRLGRVVQLRAVRLCSGAWRGPRAENSMGWRGLGRGGGADAADLVDPVGAMSGAVGSFGVEQEPPGAAAPQRVRLDAAPAAVVEQVYAEVDSGGETGRLQRHADAPGGDGRRWRPRLSLALAGKGGRSSNSIVPSSQPKSSDRSRPGVSGGRAGPGPLSGRGGAGQRHRGRG